MLVADFIKPSGCGANFKGRNLKAFYADFAPWLKAACLVLHDPKVTIIQKLFNGFTEQIN